MKIVINVCEGNFSLSIAAIKRLIELNDFEHLSKKDKEKFDKKFNCEEIKQFFNFYEHNNELYADNHMFYRTCPKLIQAVEELKEKANGENSELKIVEIPDNIKWYINTNEDGTESIHEEHRIWK